MPRDWRVSQKTARTSKLHTLRDTVERCPCSKFLRVSGLNRSSLSSVKLRCSSGEQQLSKPKDPSRRQPASTEGLETRSSSNRMRNVRLLLLRRASDLIAASRSTLR